MQRASSRSAKVSFPAHSLDDLIAALTAGLRDLGDRLPVERAVLFGSRATGRHTASSDIDLLVIYAGSPRDDAYSIVRKAIDLRGLQPHVYTRSEAVRLRDTIERMTREGIEIPLPGSV